MWESGSTERNLKQHHFSCELRITMSCTTVYSITDSQRTSIKSIFSLALGSRALLQTTQEQSSRIFPLLLANTLFFLSLYFSVLLSNSSRTILSFFLARSDSPKLSQWIYEKGPESSSSRGRMPSSIHSHCHFSKGDCGMLQGENILVWTELIELRRWQDKTEIIHLTVTQPNATSAQTLSAVWLMVKQILSVGCWRLCLNICSFFILKLNNVYLGWCFKLFNGLLKMLACRRKATRFNREISNLFYTVGHIQPTLTLKGAGPVRLTFLSV